MACSVRTWRKRQVYYGFKDSLVCIANSRLCIETLSQNIKPNPNKKYLIMKPFKFELERSVANLAGFLN